MCIRDSDLGDNGLDESALFQSLFHLPTQLEDIADTVLAVRDVCSLIDNRLRISLQDEAVIALKENQKITEERSWTTLATLNQVAAQRLWLRSILIQLLKNATNLAQQLLLGRLGIPSGTCRKIEKLLQPGPGRQLWPPGKLQTKKALQDLFTAFQLCELAIFEEKTMLIEQLTELEQLRGCSRELTILLLLEDDTWLGWSTQHL